MDLNKEKEKIIDFLRKKLEEEGKEGYIIGISGGIDSAVTLYLLNEAIGRDRILALIMPEMDSEPSSIRDALDLVQNLKVPYKVISLTKVLLILGVYSLIPLFWLFFRGLKRKAVKYIYREYTKTLSKPPFFAQKDRMAKKLRWFYEGIAYYRIKHRLRMLLLYYYAEMKNYLVVGCTNLTENLIGYYVRYGDDACDVAPIAHLYKTEVKNLAKLLNLPEKIIEKPPSPDLLPGITDEFSLGIDYETLDQILMNFELGRKPQEMINYDRDLIDLIYEQYNFTKKEKEKPLKLSRD
ncbi:MAG: NAD(+) synthase [Dictyoglomus sp.]